MSLSKLTAQRRAEWRAKVAEPRQPDRVWQRGAVRIELYKNDGKRPKWVLSRIYYMGGRAKRSTRFSPGDLEALLSLFFEEVSTDADVEAYLPS